MFEVCPTKNGLSLIPVPVKLPDAKAPNWTDVDHLHVGSRTGASAEDRFLWGIVVLVQAFFTNWAEFMAFRFIQGALEVSGVSAPLVDYGPARMRNHAVRSHLVPPADASSAPSVPASTWCVQTSTRIGVVLYSYPYPW